METHWISCGIEAQFLTVSEKKFVLQNVEREREREEKSFSFALFVLSSVLFIGRF
jgi:hypothetical protein